MAETERCGICRFFIEEREDLCVRFPPPQQAIVRNDDWCGEFEVKPRPAKPMTKSEVMGYNPYKNDIPHITSPAGSAASKIAIARECLDAETISQTSAREILGTKTKADRLSSFGELARKIK